MSLGKPHYVWMIWPPGCASWFLFVGPSIWTNQFSKLDKNIINYFGKSISVINFWMNQPPDCASWFSICAQKWDQVSPPPPPPPLPGPFLEMLSASRERFRDNAPSFYNFRPLFCPTLRIHHSYCSCGWSTH